MSNFKSQLKKEARSRGLKAAEKRELKERVVAYMEYHPRVEKVAQQKAEAYLASQSYTVWSLSPRVFAVGSGVMALVLFVLLPTVAERAVPGDVLYPIKVNINEEVRSRLTFSASEKIEWETERLERRIAEVRLLADAGKLTDEVAAEAAKAVQEHAEAAQMGIATLRTTDSDEASLAEVAFTSALEVQSAVLANNESSATSSPSGLALVVKDAELIARAAQSSSTPSYDKAIARVERETTRSYELFTSLAPLITDEERTEIERRLTDIERKVNAGIKAHEQREGVEGEIAPAPIELLHALSDTRKLISFMTDLDVRTSVKLDQLVPVTMTPEEQQAIIDRHVQAARELIKWYEEQDANLELDESAEEKLTIGLTTIKTLVDSLANEADQDVAVALLRAEQLADIVADVYQLLDEGEALEATLVAPMATTTAATTTPGDNISDESESDGEVSESATDELPEGGEGVSEDVGANDTTTATTEEVLGDEAVVGDSNERLSDEEIIE